MLFVVLALYFRHRWLARAYIGAMIVVGFLAPVAVVLGGWGVAPNPTIFMHQTHKFPMDEVITFIFHTYNHLIPYFFGVVLGLLLFNGRGKCIPGVSFILRNQITEPLTF